MTHLPLFTWSALVASLSFQATSAAQTVLPDGPAKDTLVAVCANCHDLDTVVAKRRSNDEWRLLIEGMISRGAVANDDEVATLQRYLIRHVGLVNVNTASVEELQLALGLASSDAEAIVRHRADRGEFADLETLKRVPGLDSKTVDGWKDSVVFR